MSMDFNNTMNEADVDDDSSEDGREYSFITESSTGLPSTNLSSDGSVGTAEYTYLTTMEPSVTPQSFL